MIQDTFDSDKTALFSPESFYGERVKEARCDACILTFSSIVMENFKKKYTYHVIATIGTANGPIPIYLFEHQGKKIAVYMTPIGASAAGACMEEAVCLLGCKIIIMFGSCGCLDSQIVSGKLIIPTEAYRDEGVSYHYAKASDFIRITNAEKIAKIFDELQYPYVMGKAWTTDAIYRETKGNMEKRKAQGCIAVDMECAAIQAICDFRGVELYNFFLGADQLDSQEWECRILGNEGEYSQQLASFCIALELALRV